MPISKKPAFRPCLGKPPIRVSTLGQMTGRELSLAYAILADHYELTHMEGGEVEPEVGTLYEALKYMMSVKWYCVLVPSP